MTRRRFEARHPAVLLLALAGAACAAEPARDWPVHELADNRARYATNSGYDEAAVDVVRDATAWRLAWERLNARVRPQPALPAVDFATDMIVVVAMGRQPSGGYAIDIRSASVVGAGLEITVAEHAPASGAIRTSAITSPAAVAVMPRFDGPVSVVRVDAGD
jgi:PrcB C-terminal